MINRIKIVNQDFSFIAFMQYSPVHFGNDVAVYVPFQVKSVNHLIAIHNYSNRDKKFPGISVWDISRSLRFRTKD